MVEAREKHQDPNDEDGDGAVGSAFANVSGQEEGADDDEEGPDHEEHDRQRDGLVGDFWWALLELQVNISIVSAGELGIFDFATGNASSQIGT